MRKIKINTKTKILIGVLVVGIILISGWQIWKSQISEGVFIITDKTEYKQGETIKITIKNNLDDPIFLDGCNPYILEKKEENEWLDISGMMCFIMGPAIKVNAGSKKNFERKLESDYFTGLFRLRVDYNKDCQEGKPLGQSSCKETFTVYSDEFSIKGVSVITDKGVYNQGETIKITLKNNLKESIFSHIGSGTPVFTIEYVERKTPDGNWEKLFAQCQYPHCIYDIDAPAEIKPAQSVTLEWEPWIFIDGTSETAQADLGRYRLSILYQDYRRTEWMSVYSNEFTIK